MGDVLSYNAAVQQSDPTVGDASTNTYFVISLDNASGQSITQIFSDAWVADGSFSIIDDIAMYTISVYDIPNLGKNAVLNVLRAAGFAAIGS